MSEQRLEHIEEFVSAMDGLILRLAVIVSSHLPSTEQEVASTIGEWEDIKKQLREETAEREMA